MTLSFLYFSAVALAQVNTEKTREGENKLGFSGSFKFGSTYKSGNVTLLDLKGVSRLQYKTEKNISYVVFNGQYSAKRTASDYISAPNSSVLDEDARYANNFIAHLRNSYSLSGPFSLELFSQYEQNQFILMEERVLGGIGTRIKFRHSEALESNMGVSYMFEHEQLNTEKLATDETALTRFHRGSFYITTLWTPKEGTSFVGTVYYQPRLDGLSDYRILADAGVLVKVTQHLGLGFNFFMRHDSLPPATAEEDPELATTDTATTTSFVLTF